MSTCDPRYQHQTYRVRCYRWWRYKAVYKLIVAPFYVVRWVLNGAQTITFDEGEEYIPSLSRQETMKIIWRSACAKGRVKAQHYYTTKEVLDKI